MFRNKNSCDTKTIFRRKFIILNNLKKIPLVKWFISIFGIDKAIFFTILGVVWSAISGVLGIYFIVNFLTLSEQGYWYTFQSLGALAIFAELGFFTIITQYISHEYAHLREKNGKLCGDVEKIERTISLVKFSFKFYLAITGIAFILISSIGIIFLINTAAETFILIAWIFYSFTGSLLLIVSLFRSILRGFNKVAIAQKISLVAGFANSIAIWVSLYMNLSLWALAIGGFVNVILSLFLFFSSSMSLWNQLFRTKVSKNYNWFKETFSLQWRYAISWASGYFIFQFIVPVCMFYMGADVTGKLGLSLVIVRTIQRMANSWGITKIPQLNILVSQKNRKTLDHTFNTIQKQSLLVYFAGSAFLILILIFIFPAINWSARVLPISEIIIILIAEGIYLIITNWTYYLRSHKQEPYLKISVLSALLTGISVWASFYLFSSTLIALGCYLAVQLLTLLPAKKILLKKRLEYENNQIGY